MAWGLNHTAQERLPHAAGSRWGLVSNWKLRPALLQVSFTYRSGSDSLSVNPRSFKTPNHTGMHGLGEFWHGFFGSISTGKDLRNGNSYEVPKICPSLPPHQTLLQPWPAQVKPIPHLFKIQSSCRDPLPSARFSSAGQANRAVVSAWGSLIGSRARAQPTSAAGFSDNKSGVGGFSMASCQGAFLSPFSQEPGGQQGGLGQLQCTEVDGERGEKQSNPFTTSHRSLLGLAAS